MTQKRKFKGQSEVSLGKPEDWQENFEIQVMKNHYLEYSRDIKETF